MRKIILFILIFYSINSCAFSNKTQEIILNKTKQNIDFNSISGKKRLNRSIYNNDFYQLVNFYQPQINPLFCSAASSVAILNALNYGQIESQKSGEITRPQDLGGEKISYKLHNQLDFFNNQTDEIKNRAIIGMQAKNKDEKYDAGLTLTQLSLILSKSYNLKVTKIHAQENDQESIEKFRQSLKKHLQDNTHFILANFNGKKLGSKTNGHISPLVAYDEATDSVLILDVATHKVLWYFAPLERLYSAMNTQDGENYRGYLVVSK